MKQKKIEKKKLLSSYCPQRIACSSQLSTFYKENKFGAFKISKKDNAELKINSILMQVAKLSSKKNLQKAQLNHFFTLTPLFRHFTKHFQCRLQKTWLLKLITTPNVPIKTEISREVWTIQKTPTISVSGRHRPI